MLKRPLWNEFDLGNTHTYFSIMSRRWNEAGGLCLLSWKRPLTFHLLMWLLIYTGIKVDLYVNKGVGPCWPNKSVHEYTGSNINMANIIYLAQIETPFTSNAHEYVKSRIKLQTLRHLLGVLPKSLVFRYVWIIWVLCQWLHNITVQFWHG